MRGEHSPTSNTSGREPGSSPHARGAPHIDVAQDYFVGIIPACAGSTGERAILAFTQRDHPRMRGEHPGKGFDTARARGSSPHARGAQLR